MGTGNDDEPGAGAALSPPALGPNLASKTLVDRSSGRKFATRVSVAACHRQRTPGRTPPVTGLIRGQSVVLTLATLAAVAAGCAGVARAAAPAPVPSDHPERITRGLQTFQRDVRAVLTEHCLSCHGGEKTKGGLSLATREDLLKGGEDGPVIVPFNARASRLLKLIEHQEEPYMPEKKPALPPALIAKVANWIDDGAPYDQPLAEGKGRPRDRSIVSDDDRQWWSFCPLARLEVPRPDIVQPHPVDRFLVAKARQAARTSPSPSAPGPSFSLAPAADRRTLLRRACLDLLGFPPAPEEVEAFLRDDAPDAWPRAIDRLLASPHYGERWARHWLDLARFAESSGFEHDYDRQGAFHYRDFVIRALNLDLPYDEFLRWQLAGDEFAPDNPLALAATGFLGAGVFPTQITANEVERTRYDALDDMLSTTASAFLGLSVGCARCHDHKFDPIPSRDYYQMLSAFTTTVRSVIDLDVDPGQTRRLVARWEQEAEPLRAEIARYESSLPAQFDAWLQQGAPLPASSSWMLLPLTNLSSRAGATFKSLDDGSFLVEGKNGDTDVYTLVGATPLPRVTGLRLEALAHPSMKQGGPGRADNGNIGLSRIRIAACPANGGPTQEVRLARAAADFEQNHEQLAIAAALEGRPGSGWALDPQFGKDHAAVFTFAEPVTASGGSVFRVTLEFHVNTRHNIGRPRLAVTGASEPALPGEALPPRVAGLLQRAQESKTRTNAPAFAAGDRAVLFDWWKRRDAGWRERQDRLRAHLQRKPDGRAKVLVCAEGYPPLRMHTQGADFFKETYILKRGNTDLKGAVAEPGFLQVLMTPPDTAKRWEWTPPPGARFSGRRRSLSNWLTDVDAGAGALVARVAVNRLWQHHFGRGLVATPSDFGHAGAPPSHPELLDWLAGEFVRQGWKLKPIHRLLLTSAAYQQSTHPDPSKEKADPENQWFLRRTPRRLEAEAVRDSMLAVSGQLDPTLFGPGTKDERSRRRSIYFTVKRSQLIGSMVAFDQPEPLVSQGLRPVTTVAPQALILLNGPQVRDWAGGFARRVLEEIRGETTDGAAIQRAYLLALGRPPTGPEARAAAAFLAAQAASYRADHQPEERVLALTDFCQVLFGLNDFVYER